MMQELMLWFTYINAILSLVFACFYFLLVYQTRGQKQAVWIQARRSLFFRGLAYVIAAVVIFSFHAWWFFVAPLILDSVLKKKFPLPTLAE
jgi:hypothetical protein